VVQTTGEDKSMATIILLSRMRGQWVAWRQGRAELTGFTAPTPASEVLLHFARYNPDVLVAVQGRAQPVLSSRRPLPARGEESESLAA